MRPILDVHFVRDPRHAVECHRSLTDTCRVIERPIIWTIAGTDPSGGAGIQADIKVIHALGGYAASVITAIVAQNTLGVCAWAPVSREMVRAQLHALKEDLPPRAIKIGMLGTVDAVEETVRALQDLDVTVVCDPVLAASDGTALLDEPGRQVLRERLVPRVRVLTPNWPELAVLAGRPIRSERDAIEAGRELVNAGVVAVVVKGGHGESLQDSRDWLITAEGMWCLSSPRQVVDHTHGTGCTFSSSLATFLAHGCTLLNATILAKAYVNQGLRLGGGIGRGRGPLAHLGWPQDESDIPTVTPIRDGSGIGGEALDQSWS